MGCVSSTHSKDDVTTKPSEEEKIAKQQRRRLSVAPHHVGDISAIQKLVPNEQKEEDSDLTAVELQAKGSLRVAAHSRKGVVPYNKNKVNQDRFIIKYALHDDASINLWGVMDGHGEFGHYVAQFIQDRLPVCLAAQPNLKTRPEDAILAAVAQMCSQLRETSINVTFSGSTLVFGVMIDQRLFVANVGDSRCVLCRQTPSGELQVVGLSVDQKPDVPEEKARILAAGGRVDTLPGPPGEDCGPPRVWLAEVDVPGLAMSRSIGDEVSQSVGVTSVPEIIPHDIQPCDLFAVFASDGVWEFLSNQEVCSLVWRHQHDLNEAALQLVEESVRQWKREEEVIDDITCVIIKFNDMKPVGAGAAGASLAAAAADSDASDAAAAAAAVAAAAASSASSSSTTSGDAAVSAANGTLTTAESTTASGSSTSAEPLNGSATTPSDAS